MISSLTRNTQRQIKGALVQSLVTQRQRPPVCESGKQMARQLSETQVAELADVFRVLPDVQQPSDLHRLVDALRHSTQSAFSAEELSSIEAGVRVLERPLDARPQWQASKNRGVFFVFEGLDRSGKSTQSRKLLDHLQKKWGE